VDQSTYRGDDEPLDGTSDKLKYIVGSRLAVPDPLASAAYHLRVPDGEKVQDKTLRELRGWLAYMISRGGRPQQEQQPGPRPVLGSFS
jgi:hypothetical protein